MQVPQELRGVRALLELLGQKVIPELRALRGQLALLVQLGPKATPELREP